MNEATPPSDRLRLLDQLLFPTYFIAPADPPAEPPLDFDHVFIALALLERTDTTTEQRNKAVAVITQALRRRSHDLIKRALDLKPPDQARLLVQVLVLALLEPNPNPHSEDDRWILPSKQQVEQALEASFPRVYAELPKTEGQRGQGRGRLHPRFWNSAGLTSVLPQSRGFGREGDNHLAP